MLSQEYCGRFVLSQEYSGRFVLSQEYSVFFLVFLVFFSFSEVRAKPRVLWCCIWAVCAQPRVLWFPFLGGVVFRGQLLGPRLATPPFVLADWYWDS